MSLQFHQLCLTSLTRRTTSSILRRDHVPKFLLVVWSFGFLAFTQSLILFAIAAPAYIFLVIGSIPLRDTADSFNILDTIISQGLVILLLLEIIADQQQWGYQTAKAEYKKSGDIYPGYAQEDLDRGFIVSGLWALSRHPNFACEQAIWCVIYVWTCVTTDTMFNWTAVGAVSLLAVFAGSTPFTESITAKKYPQYGEYVRLVPRFVPGVAMILGNGKAEQEEAARAEEAKKVKEREKREEEEKPVPKRRSQRKK